MALLLQSWKNQLEQTGSSPVDLDVIAAERYWRKLFMCERAVRYRTGRPLPG